MAVNNQPVRGLVDTGCSTTLVHSKLVPKCSGSSTVVAFDGKTVNCEGYALVNLAVGGQCLPIQVVVVDCLLPGVEVVLGNDVIDTLGGVYVNRGTVSFGRSGHYVVSSETPGVRCGAVGQVGSEEPAVKPIMEIADKDFCAVFDGKIWTVEWCWRDNGAPVLKNKISCYDKQLSGHKKEEFDKEVQRWIAEGILIPWHESIEVGVIPLMAVEQPTKKKVRPVLDF